MPPDSVPQWWVEGLLFENCNCQVVCPGHVHFDQLCTHETCHGYWAIRFDLGEFGSVAIGGTTAVIVYESPQHMIDGDWVQGIIIGETANNDQRDAIERILKGVVGGPWEILARFVGTTLATRYLPIRLTDDGRSKRAEIDGILQATVEAVRGRDHSLTVTFENMYNQIHNTSQVIAAGTTHFDDGNILVNTEKTHGLYSNFAWSNAKT